MTVRSEQRHKRSRPCPICGGGDDDMRGKERRCHGWTTDGGDFVHCSREELAGMLDADPNGTTYPHRMHGPCGCGTQHGEAKSDVRPKDDIEALYDYCDETGCVLYQVVRKSVPGGGKKFIQRRPDGVGGWIWSIGDTRRVPYRLPELLAADPSRVVYVVEGEKDADTVAGLGEVATCNPMGAGKWHFVAEEAAKALRGRHVVIIADADEAGRAHAKSVQRQLGGVAASVQVVEPPAPHKDVTDYVRAGLAFADLVPAAPVGGAVECDLAPELPFDEIWTPEPDTALVVPAMGIAPGPVHLVAGAWYSGKSLFLLTTGLCVASGRSIFGLYGTRRGKWLHLDYEMGRRHMKKYLQKLRAGLGIDPEELCGMMSVRVLPQLNLRREDAVEQYTRLLEGYSLVTIDPLRAAAPGANENESEFRQYLDILSMASDRTGCSVEVLHHGGKPVEGSKRRNVGRGTSAIDDAVQTKFVLTADEKKEPVHVSHEKTRELSQTMDDFWFEIVNTLDGVLLAHRGAEEMQERREKRDEEKARQVVEKTTERILSRLNQTELTFQGDRDDFIRFVGGDRSAVSEAIRIMRKNGTLRVSGRGESCIWSAV